MAGAEWLIDLFAPFGPVKTRRMFSGHGIYADGLIIALAARGEVWLKADAETERLFEAAGSRRFEYEMRGRIARLPYWTLPDAAQDDPDAMNLWAGRALEASRRAARDKQKPRREKPRSKRQSKLQ